MDPSRRWRRQPSKRTRTQLIAVTVIVTIIQVVGTLKASSHGADLSPLLPAIVLLLTGSLSLLARWRWPMPTLFTVFSVTGMLYALYEPRGPAFLALVVALFSAVRSGYRTVGFVVCGVIVVSRLSVEWISGATLASLSFTLVSSLFWVLVVVVADALRTRHLALEEQRRKWEAEQESQASRERLEIARELHDVLAHNISLINVQASVALHLFDADAEGSEVQVRNSLATIKDASKETLRQMRSVLGVLRSVDDEAPLTPAVGLGDLEKLATTMRLSGVDVHLMLEGDRSALPTSVGQAAYRIVQESLTNVARHSRSRIANVDVQCGEEELVLTVRDAGPPAEEMDREGSGNGIAGMRERAEALGGELELGPTDGGGFRVTARLPYRGEA